MFPSLLLRLNQAVRRPARSSARRAQAALLTVSFGGLAALWFIAQSLVAQITETEIRASVAARTFPLILAYGQGGILALTRETQRQAEFSQASGEDSLFLLLDARERVLAGSYNYLPPPLQGLYPGEYEVVLYPHSFATAGTGEAQAVSVFRIADFTLIVGGSLGLRDQLRRRLSLVFAVVFLPTAILLGLLSGRITRRLFARLDKIAETARQVGAGQFATRIALTQANDEFDRLSATLNQMLERNEALLSALRTTTASLAHDLRTPLTRAYARLEEATQLLEGQEFTQESRQETAQESLQETLQESSGEARARPAVDAALAEISRLRRTFDTLTAIVHAESGISAAFPDRLSYAALVQDVYDLYAPLAEEQGSLLALQLPAEAETDLRQEGFGNRQLLFSAVSNLVENALAHAKPSSPPVRMELFLAAREEAGQRLWCLGVRDNGTGMAEAARRRALQGFLLKSEPQEPEVFASQEESSASVPVLSGLGLILASAVARLHGGVLLLENQTPAKETLAREIVAQETRTDGQGQFVAALVLPARPTTEETKS